MRSNNAANSHGWLNQNIISCATGACLTSLNYGINISIIDGTKSIFVNQNASAPFSYTVSEKNWSYNIFFYCIGGIISSSIGGILVNYVGTVWSLLLTNICFFISPLLFCFCQSITCMIVSRFIVGIASGLTSVTIPIYLSEISNETNRGRVGSFNMIFLVVGIFISQVLTILFPDHLWFLNHCISGLVAVIGFIWVLSLPAPSCEHIGESMEGRNSEDYIRKYSIKELFGMDVARKSLVTIIFSHFAQQFSGINFIYSYSKTLFAWEYTALLFGLVNIIMTLLSSSCIDSMGRKTLLISSLVIMIISGVSIIFSSFYYIVILNIVGVIIYQIGFSIGLGIIPWILVADIFPINSLSSAASIALVTNWVSQLLMALISTTLMTMKPAFLFLPFVIVISIYLLYTIFYIPETKSEPAGFLK